VNCQLFAEHNEILADELQRARKISHGRCHLWLINLALEPSDVVSDAHRNGKYGLMALAHLAALGPRETTQALEIAEANNSPKKFLDAFR
jgi:hypothetical protein